MTCSMCVTCTCRKMADSVQQCTSDRYNAALSSCFPDPHLPNRINFWLCILKTGQQRLNNFSAEWGLVFCRSWNQRVWPETQGVGSGGQTKPLRQLLENIGWCHQLFSLIAMLIIGGKCILAFKSGGLVPLPVFSGRCHTSVDTLGGQFKLFLF